MYIEGDPQGRGVAVTPVTSDAATCFPIRIADELVCSFYSVYCLEPTDNVILRISTAGKILFNQVSCSDIVASAFDFDTKRA